MYVRPEESIVYHVIATVDRTTFSFKCGRQSDRIADGPRATTPARVCVPCQREEISAT